MARTVTSQSEFNRLIAELAGSRLVVVQFYAIWHEASHVRVAPYVEQLPSAFPDVIVVKIDVDDHSDIAIARAVRSLPTFQLFKRGEMVDQVIGTDTVVLDRAIRLRM